MPDGNLANLDRRIGLKPFAEDCGGGGRRLVAESRDCWSRSVSKKKKAPIAYVCAHVDEGGAFGADEAQYPGFAIGSGSRGMRERVANYSIALVADPACYRGQET